MDISLRLTETFPNLQVHAFESLGSTSDFLMANRSRLQFPCLCYTQYQTAGRGTFQKSWDSDKTSLTFSLGISIPKTINALHALSILVGLKTLNTIQSIYPSTQLYFKWPNDIYDDQGKLAGILIEVLQAGTDFTQLSIGIGINLTEKKTEKVRTGFQDGRSALAGVHKERLLFNLIDSLLQLSEREQFLLSEDELQYAIANDYLKLGQSVKLLAAGEEEQVIYRGLNALGECLVEKNGQLITLRSSQHSLRETFAREGSTAKNG